MALQNWALFWKAAQKSCGAIAFGSTSGSTIAGSLPPSSKVSRLSVPAAERMTCLPVSVWPVKAILAMPGWAVIHLPSSSPPETTLNTPGGTMSFQISPSFSVESGVNGEGLTMIVSPAISAGAIFHMASITGKFQGTMAPTTPSGEKRVTTRRSGPSSTTSSCRRCFAVSRSQAAPPNTSTCAPASGLPCSRISRRQSPSAFASRAAAIFSSTAARCSQEVLLQLRKACAAAATASSSCSFVASGTRAISARVAGLKAGRVCVEPTSLPPISMR